MGEYYGPDGTPLTAVEWAELFEARRETVNQPESWWRKQTKGDDWSISTVWLGLNYSASDEYQLSWETMVFGGEYNQWTWRYSSREDAFDDHERIVRALRCGHDPGLD